MSTLDSSVVSILILPLTLVLGKGLLGPNNSVILPNRKVPVIWNGPGLVAIGHAKQMSHMSNEEDVIFRVFAFISGSPVDALAEIDCH